MAGVVGVLLLVATATVPVLFGYHTYIVKGSSMEPNLRLGSVAVTSPTSPQALKVGDIVAWHPSPQSPPVLHRIAEITTVDGKRSFVTQGDQNHTPDRQPQALEGPGDRVVYSVPYAGYVLSFAEGSTGRVALIGVPLALLIVLSLREGRRSAQVRKEPGTGLSPVERQTAPAAAETQTAPAAAVVTPTTQQVAPIRADVRTITPGAAPTPPVAGPFKTERLVDSRGGQVPAAPAPPVASPFKRERSQSDLPVFLVRQLPGRRPFEPSTRPAAASSSGGPIPLRSPPSPEWPQRKTRRVA
jgi:signal peptidase